MTPVLVRRVMRAFGILCLGFLTAPLWLLTGCEGCQFANSLRTIVEVRAPRAGFVPLYCASSAPDAHCRASEEVEGLVHRFLFDQLAEGGFVCQYPSPPGEIRMEACPTFALDLPQPEGSVGVYEERTLELIVEGCDLSSQRAPRLNDACAFVSSPEGAPPTDSCGGPPLFCDHHDRCRTLPEGCSVDADCDEVTQCDQSDLCITFLCDPSTSQCVRPDQCIEDRDCRTYRRCESFTSCQTFTCEQGRCEGG